MKVLLVAVLLALPAFASAILVEYPTIRIKGVTHYLAGADDSTGESLKTWHGYCAKIGLSFTEGYAIIDATLKPIAVLDASGKLVRILPDNKSGKVWVVEFITCD